LGTRIVAILMLLQFCFATYAVAGIYCYVDEQGVVHFSNVPTDNRYKLYKASRKPLIKKRKKKVKSFCPSESYYDRHLLRASIKYGLDFALLKAVVKAESNFNPYAVSPKGAQGLMQLMPKTSELLNVKNPFDPEENILAGTRYLKMLMKQFNNNIIFALAAYNAGPDVVSQYNGIPPYPETITYVKRVLEYFRDYKNKIRLSMK